MTRKLVIQQNITVDGVIDMTGGWGDPDPSGASDAEAIAEMTEVETELRSTADALLVGRSTFEAFRTYWPEQKDDVTGVSDYLNRVRKYVLSSTLTDPGWENSEILRGPLTDHVRRIKQQDGGDIVVTGSLSLIPGLVASGLVDEYRLIQYPVAVGTGARLFEGHAVRLTLLDSEQFRNGVMLLRYAAAA